ncbi:hypothetical protein [Isoptericola aurantiacus]|uniref:hypothetical protein n=1 Tax=Isoptericola aurantiacus TaxID=3377839 RepID=UPI00383A0327
MSDDGIDLQEIRGLASRLAAIPKEFHREVRKPLRAAGQGMLNEARANAAWSSRIPASLSLRVTLSGRRPGISVRASLKAAPHARAYEGILDNPFKHPLFGDFEFWYSQAARPYLLPAVQEGTEQVVDAVTRVVDDVHARAGLT